MWMAAVCRKKAGWMFRTHNLVIKNKDKSNGRSGERRQEETTRCHCCWWRWTCVTHAHDMTEMAPAPKKVTWICLTFQQPAIRPFRLLLIVLHWGRTESNIRVTNGANCAVAANEGKTCVSIRVNVTTTDRYRPLNVWPVYAQFRDSFSFWRRNKFSFVAERNCCLPFTVFVVAGRRRRSTHVFLV